MIEARTLPQVENLREGSGSVLSLAHSSNGSTTGKPGSVSTEGVAIKGDGGGSSFFTLGRIITPS